MSTFTIYNCGTMFSRENKGELIRELAVATESANGGAESEYVSWLINDGPGATPLGGPSKDPYKEYDPRTRLAGSFDPFTRDKKPYPKPEGLFADTRAWFAKQKLAIKGGITGYGWDYNVAHSLWAIQEYLPSPPTAINLAGWSRGGVTCHKIAWYLHKNPATKDIPVNIFAVDPVPGPEHEHEDDIWSITPNVKNYVGVIMQHERRVSFTPLDIVQTTVVSPTNTRALYLVYPGGHGTPVLFTGDNKDERHQVTHLVRYCAYKFLTAHGTTIDEDFFDANISQPATSAGEKREIIVERYNDVRLRYKDYEKLKNKGLADRIMSHSAKWLNLSFGRRDVLKVHSSAYTLHADVFINEHHRLAFKASFPGIYDFLFTKRVRYDRKALEKDVQIIEAAYPKTWELLEDMFGFKRKGKKLRIPFGAAGSGMDQVAKAKAKQLSKQGVKEYEAETVRVGFIGEGPAEEAMQEWGLI